MCPETDGLIRVGPALLLGMQADLLIRLGAVQRSMLRVVQPSARSEACVWRSGSCFHRVSALFAAHWQIFLIFMLCTAACVFALMLGELQEIYAQR